MVATKAPRMYLYTVSLLYRDVNQPEDTLRTLLISWPLFWREPISDREVMRITDDRLSTNKKLWHLFTKEPRINFELYRFAVSEFALDNLDPEHLLRGPTC